LGESNEQTEQEAIEKFIEQLVSQGFTEEPEAVEEETSV